MDTPYSYFKFEKVLSGCGVTGAETDLAQRHIDLYFGSVEWRRTGKTVYFLDTN
jgi:hypothetical protein